MKQKIENAIALIDGLATTTEKQSTCNLSDQERVFLYQR